jgi:hypothetical protein
MPDKVSVSTVLGPVPPPPPQATKTAAAAGNKTNLNVCFNIKDLSDRKNTDQSILLVISNFCELFF